MKDIISNFVQMHSGIHMFKQGVLCTKASLADLNSCLVTLNYFGIFSCDVMHGLLYVHKRQ